MVVNLNFMENFKKNNNEFLNPDKNILSDEKYVFRIGMSPSESNKKIGAIRSHLYNYFFSKNTKLKNANTSIIFRIDDTNKLKHDKETALELYDFFTKNLGLEFEINPHNSHDLIGQSVFQSERQEIYNEYLEKLFENHLAFIDKDSGLTLFDIKKFIDEYTEVLEISDLNKGNIKLDVNSLIDQGKNFFPLMRSDKSSLYNFSSVVDDSEFNVTHIVRGIDKMPISKFQEMVRIALNLQPKKYLHTPMLLGKDGELLNGEVKFNDFLKDGIVPNALISYMISSGYGNPDEIYPSTEEFIKNFDYRKIHNNNGKFDINKLKFVNKKIIKKISDDEYIESIKLYLINNGKKNQLEELGNHNLSELLYSLRLNPEDSLNLMKSINEPHFNSIEENDRKILIDVLNNIETNGHKFPNVSSFGLEKGKIYSIISWILTGNFICPEIEKIFEYFVTNNILGERINLINNLIEYNMSPEKFKFNSETSISNKVFPEKLPTINEIENKYPKRELPEGAMVTRIAPSPTGYMHIGSLYTALISERLAHKSNGVFYLRIEDTDKKREVEGAVDVIVESLKHYNINIDEGPDTTGKENGIYGPYKQSERGNIYNSYAKKLLDEGLAYPCFCTSEEIDEIRAKQEESKDRIGYYGNWAVWRNKSQQEVLKAIEEGKKPIIRFKSEGNFDSKISTNDILKGNKELPENDQDIVLIKSDGLPTYHFAHVIDDHLMGTTHVIRGDEWLSSTPLHLQLFEKMGWKPPQYGHLSPIQKIEGESRRKLSKRKDPEAGMIYYETEGYPESAVIEYLLNLASSGFEDWRKNNPNSDYSDFGLKLEKLPSSGALFDFAKLNDISKEIVSKYSAEELFEKVLIWSEKNNEVLFSTMNSNTEYVKKILDIERGGYTKRRKDISKWSDVQNYIEYFFDDNFKANIIDTNSDVNSIKEITSAFLETYDENDSNEEWFSKIKSIAIKNGYADSPKLFKSEPEKYKGTVADVAKILRVLVTGRVQSPDLYSIMKIMGRNKIEDRLLSTNRL